MSTVSVETAPPEAATARSNLRRLLADPAVLIAATFLALVVLAALAAPLIVPYDPFETNLRNILKAPSAQHWLGTDEQGRDMLSRLLYGARITLLMGLAAVALGGAVGMAMGILAAFYRPVEGVLMRVVDVLLSFPAILFGLAIAAVFGAGVTSVVIALAIATVPDVARVSRGAAKVVMGEEFMEAGRAVGLPDWRLIAHYLLPNCIASIFVYLTLRFGQVILLGAALGFLGLGAQPPTAELGTMAAQGRNFLFIAPHVSTIPSVLIFAIVLAGNVLGDGLRDVLDPRLRD